MSRVPIGRKAPRVVAFLEGISEPRAWQIMEQHGFSESEFTRGMALLTAFIRCRYRAQEPPRGEPPVIGAIDAFENKWFPIARITLATHYPAIAEEVFLNLARKDDSEVALTVPTLLARIHALETGDRPDAAERRAARALLAERGFTEAVVREGEALVRQMQRVGRGAVPSKAARQETIDAANALWTWYIEWSSIARAAIKDRQLLRNMGFLRSRRSEVDPEDESLDGDEGVASEQET